MHEWLDSPQVSYLRNFNVSSALQLTHESGQDDAPEVRHVYQEMEEGEILVAALTHLGQGDWSLTLLLYPPHKGVETRELWEKLHDLPSS